MLKLKTQFDQEDAKTEAAPAPGTGIAGPESEDKSMNLNRIPWIWAQAMVLADSPTKIPVEGAERSAASEPVGTAVLKADDAHSLPSSATPALNAESVVDGLLALIRSARQDLLVVSPYFVPGPEIMDAFRAARSKGVRIRC